MKPRLLDAMYREWLRGFCDRCGHQMDMEEMCAAECECHVNPYDMDSDQGDLEYDRQRDERDENA